MQNLAPIVLFVYNRPEHTRRTLKFLQQNLLADESRLFIYSDAAASPADESAVAETRELIRNVSGFKSVKVIEQKNNKGLAESIIQGVTEVVESYGKVIVFEDDLLSSPYTLSYFNEALRRYEQEEGVMHINAYMYPLKNAETLPPAFFTRLIGSWGWATWKRAWRHFEPDVNQLYTHFDKQKKFDFAVNGRMNFWKQLVDYKNGLNNSWAIRWYASVFLNHGLALSPKQSLVENIGNDGSGVHSIIEDTYSVKISTLGVKLFPELIEEDDASLKEISNFFRHRKGNLFKRGKKFLTNQYFRFKKAFK